MCKIGLRVAIQAVYGINSATTRRHATSEAAAFCPRHLQRKQLGGLKTQHSQGVHRQPNLCEMLVTGSIAARIW